LTEAQDLIEEAVRKLWNDELVAFPTETVYGIGAHAARPAAVSKIFSVKGRPADHPLIVHIPGAKWLNQWASNIPDAAWALAEACWPGALTLILEKQQWVPDNVTGGQKTVGLRVPNHPLALELLHAFAEFGRPGRGGIAAPSANRFGHISPTTAAHVWEDLGEHVSLILDGGACSVGIESTIVDLSRETPSILRPGAISTEQIAEILGTTPRLGYRTHEHDAPRVSGTHSTHYAPRAPATLMRLPELLAWLEAHPEEHCAVLAYTLPTILNPSHIWRMMPYIPDAYARELYNALRHLDHRCPSRILIEAPPETSDWAAVNNRLVRAATQRATS
jgi:L-threonylcarbamoyladenylate synthase